MDLDSCLVNLCNSFVDYKYPHDKIRSGFFISKLNKNFYCYSLYQLAKWGYIDMIKYHIRINTSHTHLLDGMLGAVEGGHLDIIKFLYKLVGSDLDKLKRIAITYGRKDVIEFFEELGDKEL